MTVKAKFSLVYKVFNILNYTSYFILLFHCQPISEHIRITLLAFFAFLGRLDLNSNGCFKKGTYAWKSFIFGPKSPGGLGVVVYKVVFSRLWFLSNTGVYFSSWSSLLQRPVLKGTW